jgi:alkylation response protein AidB-like acyl-CoA dehydrogenase
MISAIGERSQPQPMGAMAAAHIGRDAAGRLDDPLLRARIAVFEVDEAAFRALLQRFGELSRARQAHGAFSSALKYYGAELNKRRQELIMSALGSAGLEWEGEASNDGAAARDWLRSKANSIEGGTSEVQLNVIAKRILELPGA